MIANFHSQFGLWRDSIPRCSGKEKPAQVPFPKIPSSSGRKSCSHGKMLRPAVFLSLAGLLGLAGSLDLSGLLILAGTSWQRMEHS